MAYYPRPSEQIKQWRMTEARATRAALETTFKFWLRTFAPRHFTRQAFGDYREYDESAKADRESYIQTHQWRIDKGWRDPEIRPARESGRLENAFLHGGYTFGAALRKLAVRWPGLPAYAKQPNRYSGFQLIRALTAVNDAEYTILQQFFERQVKKNVKKAFAADKSRGRAVI